MTEEKPRILVVDDEAAQMQALCATLPGHGYAPIGFTDGEAALEQLRRTKCDLLLADLTMPRMDGIMLLHAAQKIDPDLVTVIMTGGGTIATAVEAMKAGALDYILKPFNLSAIIPVLERALGVRRLRLENAELERRVRERTLELEAANKELEAFSFSVAHDLRSPLTATFGHAELLIEDYALQLPREAMEHLDAIVAAAEQMRRLIDGLLRLSRLGRQPLSRHPVDVASLVREVLDELQRANAGRQIAVHVGELPDCIGDQALLRQVVANLLSNAFKFTGTRKNAVVAVTGGIEGNERIYSVRDNGTGFDMKQADRLFAAFQRLHNSDQYEGTGIGLSIVARVVQRHGGRIWAKAEPDRGATFGFSIPE
jgi:two-component system sensor histidine kinase/response regulator